MEPGQETKIINHILQGESEAYALLVDAYKTPIFNLAYRMTGSYDDAAELAQETFLRAFIKLRSFNPERRFFPWLYTIALNISKDYLKRRAIFRLAMHDSAVSGEDERNPETDMLLDEQTNSIASCLIKLPLDQREALILRFYQGLSFTEMTAILHCSESAIKMRIYRALDKLKLLLQKE